MTAEKTKQNEEARIRGQIDAFIKAFQDKDLEGMMSLYAPGFVAFDIVPPLQDVGKDTYRKVWERTFAFFEGPVDFETRDLAIIADNDIAFSHQLLHLVATMTNGQKVDRWQRATFCFRKMEGQWLIAHEHASVPVDLMSNKALVDLKPGPR